MRTEKVTETAPHYYIFRVLSMDGKSLSIQELKEIICLQTDGHMDRQKHIDTATSRMMFPGQ